MRKWIWFIVGIVVLIIIVLGMIWLITGGLTELYRVLGASTSGVEMSVPPPANEVPYIPDSAVAVTERVDKLTLAERFNPAHIRTRTEELTEGLPEGATVYEVVTPEGDTTLIYETPGGDTYTVAPPGTEVNKHVAGREFIKAIFRPKVLATTNLATAGGGVAVDLVRVWEIKAGIGAGINADKTAWIGGEAGYTVLGDNVDIGIYGGPEIYNDGFGIHGAEVGVYGAFAFF